MATEVFSRDNVECVVAAYREGNGVAVHMMLQITDPQAPESQEIQRIAVRQSFCHIDSSLLDQTIQGGTSRWLKRHQVCPLLADSLSEEILPFVKSTI